jgi:uncharacterized membrane protein
MLFKTLLALHIIAGTIGLLLGIIILVRKKGNKSHKTLGRIFSYAMLFASALSFVLSILHQNIFLFCIGILTIHFVITGWRYLYLKKLDKMQKPLLIDWVVLVAMLLFSLLFFYMGINTLLHNNNFGIAPIVFGLIGIKNVRNDYRIYAGHIFIQNYWLTNHLERMTSAFVASFTAFLVNVVAKNIEQFPMIAKYSFFTWILPAIIVVPIMIKWKRKYELKKTLTIKH